MSKILTIHDREQLRGILSPHRTRLFYEMGDLDDPFFQQTVWFVDFNDGEPNHLAVLYIGDRIPVLLAIDPTDSVRESYVDFVRRLTLLLPSKIYAHLTPGYRERLADLYEAESPTLGFKMAISSAKFNAVSKIEIQSRTLVDSDKAELNELYRQCYPGNWFTSSMLETGQYIGLVSSEELVAAGGVHIYAPSSGIAVLGNIVCKTSERGRGLGKELVTRLVKQLARTVEIIGLNVWQSNEVAIHCYKSLGFKVSAQYEEMYLSRK